MNSKFLAYRFQPAVIRSFIAALLTSMVCPALHAQNVTGTATTLALSQPGSVATGITETLSASVATSGNGFPLTITRGLVTFYDGKKLLGTGQIITTLKSPAGAEYTAVLRTRLGIGAHSLTATYSGWNNYQTIAGVTSSYAGSKSAAQPLTVTGTFPLSLSLSASASSPYTLTAGATVTGTRYAPPASIVFYDAGNTLLLGASSLATPPTVVTAFPRASTTSAVDSPFVATADFNNDGIPDLAVAYDSIVKVMLGVGDGTFKTQILPAFNTRASLEGITTGDFNGDGIPDLALSDAVGNVLVLQGVGDGTFGSDVSVVSGGTYFGITTGDFNGDGSLDIAATDIKNNAVAILLSNGDGTFKSSSIPTGNSPLSIAAGDLNGDGIDDLVVANASDSTVTKLQGNGDGTFKAVTLPTGKLPSAVVIGDFNGDGRLDVATANNTASTSGGLSVLFQNEDGSFTLSGSYSLPGAETVVTGDFNGDGVADLALGQGSLAYGASSHAMYVLLGDGKGGFQVPLGPIALTGEANAMVVADFNGDGIPDVASGELGTSGVSSTLSTVEVFDAMLTTTTSASIVAAVPGGGTHSVVAEYTGTANFSPTLSNVVSIKGVSQATTLVLTAPASAQPGRPSTLTAQLSPFEIRSNNDDVLSTDGEKIAFLSGTTTLGTAVLSGGVATLNVNLPAGTDQLVAKFTGDYIFAASTSNTATVKVGSPTEALSSLKGQYAFLIHAVQPYTANTPIDEAFAGSFSADGAGHITAGVEDINIGTGAALAVTFTGTYTVAADGSGTGTVTNSQGQSLTFGLTISGMETNGTAASANLILLGGTLNGAGVLLQQSPAEFALADVQGSYAFALTGETCYASCTTKTTNTGSVSANWRMLLSNSTTLSATANEQVGATPYQSLALSGTATAPSSTNGRMTLTMNALTSPVDHPTSYVVYVVDSVHLLLLSTSSHSTTMLLSGEGQYQ